MPGLGTITSSAALQKPEIVIRPDPDRAAELGVTTETLSLVTRIATSGDVETGLAKFNLDNRQIPIRVRLNDASRSESRGAAAVAGAGPARARSTHERRGRVARRGTGADHQRIDRSRNITITANLNGVALGDALEQIEALPSMRNLPEGVRHLRTGDSRWIVEIFSQFAIAMAIGVLSIYAVLVMLFHKFIQPVTILTALPPSAAGAIFALSLFGYGLAINSLIGLLMLMGIVSKNSILLVEYAIMAQRDRGHVAVRRAHRLVLEARPADRDDDDRNDRGHDAHRDGMGRRSKLPLPDGRCSGRRVVGVDRDEPVHRARDVQRDRRLPAVARAQVRAGRRRRCLTKRRCADRRRRLARVQNSAPRRSAGRAAALV